MMAMRKALQLLLLHLPLHDSQAYPALCLADAHEIPVVP
jgi:hypothetical protein